MQARGSAGANNRFGAVRRFSSAGGKARGSGRRVRGAPRQRLFLCRAHCERRPAGPCAVCSLIVFEFGARVLQRDAATRSLCSRAALDIAPVFLDLRGEPAHGKARVGAAARSRSRAFTARAFVSDSSSACNASCRLSSKRALAGTRPGVRLSVLALEVLGLPIRRTRQRVRMAASSISARADLLQCLGDILCVLRCVLALRAPA